MKRWVLFCEAEADFRTASRLIDELLRLRAAPWVAQGLDVEPTSIRRWHEDHSAGRSWFDLHSIASLAKRLGVQPPPGHFNGQPAEAGARMLGTIFRIVRRMQQLEPSEPPFEAVVVLWDMDQQSRQRRAGISQAEAVQAGRLPSGVALVVGCPDPIRETWVLAGFEPLDEREGALLEASRQHLGFWPNHEPHKLTAGNDQAVHHAKRVLQKDLGVIDWEREAQCLRIPDERTRQKLETRGEKCCLKKYLKDVEGRLIPLVDPAFRPPDSASGQGVC